LDAAVRRLPDVLTGPAFAGTALLLLAAAAADGHWHVLAQSGLGGVALSGFCLVLALVSPSGVGMGDVKAAAGLGIMLAWRSWTALIAGGFAGVPARRRLRHRAPDLRTRHQEASDPLRPLHDRRSVPSHPRRHAWCRFFSFPGMFRLQR
jgi:Type IV leader peptidase family